jgi:hypothetical protein
VLNELKRFELRRMMRYRYVALTAIILLIAGCKKDGEDFVPDFGYEYYPDQLGSYIIYDVDSTTWDDFFRPPLVTNRKYQIKERVESYFIDNQGREAVRIERFERDSSGAPWELKRAYYFVKNRSNVERVEENLRFVKFVFPPRFDTRWPGNKFIEPVGNNAYLANWEYRITSTGEAQTINGINYPATVSILLRDRETQIQKVYAKEIYAKNIGLVYQEWMNLEAQTNFQLPWPNRTERGFSVKMQAIAYGVE